MKKILTSLALLGAVAGGVYAQKNIDLQFTALNPVNGQQFDNFANGDTMLYAFAITNAGTDTVVESDTILIDCYGIIQDNSGSYYFTYSVDSIHLNPGETDTIGFITTQGENWGAGNDGDVTTVFPNNSVDTFQFVCYAVDVDDNIFNDPDIDMDAGNVSGNNLITTGVTFGTPTGISDINYKKESLNIYPNPANANVNVKYNFTKTTEAGIRVVDVTGRTVINNNLGKQAAGEKVFTVDVSSLPPGMYTVELVTDDVRAISKLTVTK